MKPPPRVPRNVDRAVEAPAAFLTDRPYGLDVPVADTNVHLAAFSARTHPSPHDGLIFAGLWTVATTLHRLKEAELLVGPIHYRRCVEPEPLVEYARVQAAKVVVEL